MSTSEDEYDAQLGGPVELTQEDCDRIDAICAAHAQPSSVVARRHIEISIEEEAHKSPSNPEKESPNPDAKSAPLKYSPYKLFRRTRGRLSVTDIVGPSWCEIQFEYGLAQGRWRKPKHRPTSFVTRRGRVMTTNQQVAEVNEKVLDNGKAIHDALEIEIHAPQKPVFISIKEEEWGLKLFNMLGYVESLLSIGKCREFPVMGFIHDQLVVGIIDEICYLPSSEMEAYALSSASPKRSPASGSSTSPRFNDNKASADATPTKLNGEKGGTSDADIEIVIPRKTHTLHLVDSKTRMSLSLPDYSATLSSRMQLMLYKRLLDGLTSLTSPFEFDRLWRELGLNPNRHFSHSFLRQIYSEGENEHNPKCLRDFEKQWTQAIEILGVSGGRDQHNKPVHDDLVLVYRRRPGDLKTPVSTPKRKRPRWKEPSEVATSQQGLMEGLRSPRAVGVASAAISKPDSDSLNQNALEDEEIDRTQSLLNDGSDPALQAVILESFETLKRKGPVFGQDVFSKEKEPEIPIGGIIGRICFQHDDKALDDYVTSVLKWWHGERDPVGVSMQDVHRCYTCEYMTGCEWREDKAREA